MTKKEKFYKILNPLVANNRIDDEEAYIINNYVGYLEMENKNQKEILDKIKEYAEKYKIIGVIAPEENEYMVHILKLLEEIE